MFPSFQQRALKVLKVLETLQGQGRGRGGGGAGGCSGCREMQNWGHSLDCGPLDWERNSVFAYTHQYGGCRSKGAFP